MPDRAFEYLKDFIFIAISSALLVLSFPEFNLGILAWISLIPLLLAISEKRPAYGFVLSTICGIFFFLGVFRWILVIRGYTLLHHGLLALYLGSYFGFFGLIFCFIGRRRGPGWALFAAPFIWICLEYIRSRFLFLALPWGLLGHTQYRYPLVIQIAAITGTYGISFWVVMVNAALASWVFPLVRHREPAQKSPEINLDARPHRPLLIYTAIIFTALTFIYGYVTVSGPIVGESVRISAIQGNIEQSRKFDSRFADEIMRIYTSMTREAAEYTPDLIVWPETATPGSVSRNLNLRTEIAHLVGDTGVPVLTGSAEYQKFEKSEDAEGNYFNSAILFEPQSGFEKPQQYNKIRLFPFGEYLPYHQMIPWARLNVPRLGHYLPGGQFTVFELPAFRFSTTICWENVFADVVRQFVRQGAECIINITNEGHFGKTAAPYQLTAISVFRAVENRIFIVRCGNTGVSCVIDPYGRILDRVKNDRGEDIFIRGILKTEIVPLKSETIYTRFGEIAVWVGFLGSFIILLPVIYRPI
jgi:apolipoprotein N-acyltransferase